MMHDVVCKESNCTKLLKLYAIEKSYVVCRVNETEEEI